MLQRLMVRTKVSAVTIHAESLSDSSHFSYNGEEYDGELDNEELKFATNDRIIVSDARLNWFTLVTNFSLDWVGLIINLGLFGGIRLNWERLFKG